MRRSNSIAAGVNYYASANSAKNPAKTTKLSLSRQLHAQITVHALRPSLLCGSKLFNCCVQVGSFRFATKTSDSIAVKNLHSWNAISSAFFKNNDFSQVLRSFRHMRTAGCSVDSFNLTFAIKASVRLSRLQDGNLLHGLAIKSGLERDPYVVPALIGVYTELGSLGDAQKLFEGVSEWNGVIWGALMKGYLKSPNPANVFELLSDMRTSGFQLDPFTSECLVRACGYISACKEGKSVHAFCIKQNFTNSNIYLLTCLLDMYLKLGLLDAGLKLFKEVPRKDVVLWTTLISGLAKNGRAWEAVNLFRQMLRDSIVPNRITLASIVLACSHTGSLQQGKSVHGYMIRNGVELDVVNYTSLVDMYANCGSIVPAYAVFKEMPIKNVFSWSAMVNGFGMHGLCEEALALFDQMRSDKQLPNPITFVSVLSACSHSGKVEEGWTYFKSMSRDYGLTPMAEHFACMIDLLGRAGKIDEALSFINDMTWEPGASAWGALLSACRIHKRVELAEQVAERLLPLEPDKSSVYISLSNIYGDAGMWDMVKKMRLKIGENGLHKSVGFTSIEVDKKLHFFSSENRYKDAQVQAVWTSLQEQMREFGYEHYVSFVHYEGDDEVEEEILSGMRN
ncbi:pentatricopeptide repeat-containing protein At1g06140, mitochondrial [Diospyros lotus]|uniref:pentatricopeptide repeat-containing protein At1g06140, mitochondrial n=1 Tax=Diospyros lotus TaxID=55363 RepID=UPI0022583CE4|nr:pentatricopeptide repeat-containing protein At1g06140, mitochondrial [Diospyros lotus]